jgi:NAD+ diphosphatase
MNKVFPRLDPAVIMLITYKDHCLLGRQKIWPKGMHSTLAGFVEHGETIEQAVERETFEETGVRIKNIQYKYSQAWPFPSSLMLGFHAEAIDQSLNINFSELEKAEWFSKDFLKSSPENTEFKMPGKISIARKLIKDWLY